MKQELMIGDYVKYTNPPYIKVASITKKKIGYHVKPNEPRMHYIRLCEVNPVPLTQEILEKNGFEFLTVTDTWYLQVEEKKPIHIRFMDGFIAISINCNIIPMRLKYVHQLQHIIRLCGIKKEIEL